MSLISDRFWTLIIQGLKIFVTPQQTRYQMKKTLIYNKNMYKN